MDGGDHSCMVVPVHAVLFKQISFNITMRSIKKCFDICCGRT